MRKVFSPIFILLFLGLVIRLLFVPAPGFEADIAYWKWWGEAASKGPAFAITTTSVNYPPFFIYVLGLIWKTYTIVAPFETAKSIWQTNTFMFLLVVKLPAILADLGIAYLLYKLVQLVKLVKLDQLDKSALFAAALYLFNPVTIFDSAFWGQTDSIAALLVLLSLVALLKNHLFLSAIIAVIAFETKVQTIVFTPLLYLLILRWSGVKKFVQVISVSAATFLIINLPYILSHTMVRAMSLILESASYFPQASLNAYNIWWLITGGKGFETGDATLVANAITYKSLGMLAYLTIFALISIYLWQNTKTKDVSRITYHVSLSFSLAAFAFYMLPTQIHERYLFPIFVFLPLLVSLAYAKYKESSQNVSRITYHVSRISFYLSLAYLLLVALSSFLNLHLVLVLNYPDNGFPLLSLLNKPGIYLPITLLLSLLNIILFLILLIRLIRQIRPKTSLFPLFLLFLLFLLLPLFSSFITRQKSVVFLSSLKPVFAQQDWGKLQKNKTVDSRLLSSAYVWYENGLGTHANSKIAYNLAGQYKKFSTDIGVDTESQDNATVQFIIEADGKELYKSPIMKKWTWPQHVEVNVASAKTLVLIVTDAADGKNGDHADWLNSKLYK